MKNLSILFLAIILLAGCKKEEEDTNLCSGTECVYTLAAGETAGNLPASLDGVYNLTSQYAQPGSPFPDGTTGTFTLEGDKLTVEIAGQACITLKNPYQTSPSEEVFVDDCRDNYKYAVSESALGGLNEVNLGSMSGGFYCQFR